MDFKVISRPTFLDDLEKTVRQIVPRNPEAAKKLGDQIIAASESLSFFPERHPRVRRRKSIRRFIVGKYYKVFYRVRVETRTVEILRCWDGRRETDPVLL